MTWPHPPSDSGPVLPAVPEVESWVFRYRRIALVLALAAAFANGVAESMSVEGRILAIMTFASAVSVWCGLDARVHGKLFLRSFAWLMMFTWPVGVLVYLVWARRWHGCVTYVALALAAAAAGIAGAAAGAALTKQ